ncbi:bifunctional phosphopantothenoylcysteine decarboxylase/phosphopantothenate synthase [Legionella lansingensis]|uniref:Coenzyme A biosynthesis bifunctional protein CoaBC n=1 Tax=Legionella lansingensis TaxID=45067 RepID=A0A0W0VET1_9GAMM|nr:bifunctional phosphopantothenoylcysteine decarboxylase/phosphopantothenate--cysteine ligase CoaBC [Legionella lansingensis]KTD18623.1 bifunctional phosphopantothenoylcysteine decarboxylase/phosphopantothenate synthase [Legionella lansingensis]SNV46215.1 bifunctional phosphopantothenoylcysteine decarboxylase/phosphopantothenate synthase [Legionella lansingensis]
MQDFATKKIVLGISGGIAAYKSAYLVRELTNLGAEVRVVMTASAQQFISPLTFQALSGHQVGIDLFDEQAERGMGHIELARWADYLIIAPASANCLAKMANGLADDLLTTLYLVAETPVIACPAMNRSMWRHPATQANCALLQRRGVMLVGPEEGTQACGEEGLGRLAEIESIINALRLYEINGILRGKTILMTAGPTCEAVDPVRYLSNHSSGKMGYALAEAASRAGAKVILISGPTSLIPPAEVEMHYVDSAKAMHDAVMKHLQEGMIFIGTAAVADYHIESPAHEKIKKKDGDKLELKLTLNPDIIADVAASGKASFVVGFAAETTDVIKHAEEKMRVKGLNMIVANQVSEGKVFGSDYNQVTVLTKDKQFELPLIHKVRAAGQIIAILATSIQNDSHAHVGQ